jgi:IclR family pca regulon transcriptional regulator
LPDSTRHPGGRGLRSGIFAPHHCRYGATHRADARRYLLTLTAVGYMRHGQKQFSLTPGQLRPSQSYPHSSTLPRIAQPLPYRLAYGLGDGVGGSPRPRRSGMRGGVSAGQLISATLPPGTRLPRLLHGKRTRARRGASARSGGRLPIAGGAEKGSLRIGWLTGHGLATQLHASVMLCSTRNLNRDCARSPYGQSFCGDIVAGMNISVHACRMSVADARPLPAGPDKLPGQPECRPVLPQAAGVATLCSAAMRSLGWSRSVFLNRWPK